MVFHTADESRDDGTVPRIRAAAKSLVIDREGRVLLIRFRVDHGPLHMRDYWALPGGAVEHGETFAQAAVRELAEETGIRVVSVGCEIDRRSFRMTMGSGEVVTADERYFAVQVETGEIGQLDLTDNEKRVIAEMRWWTIEEIAASSMTIWPAGLTEMLRKCKTVPNRVACLAEASDPP